MISLPSRRTQTFQRLMIIPNSVNPTTDNRHIITNFSHNISVQGTLNLKIKVIYHKKFLKNTSSIPEGEPFGILLDCTNFYMEAGGPKYNTMSITIGGVTEFEVFNVQAYSGYVVWATVC